MLTCNPGCKLQFVLCVGLCPKWRMGCTKLRMTEESQGTELDAGEDRCLGCLEVGLGWREELPGCRWEDDRSEGGMGIAGGVTRV